MAPLIASSGRLRFQKVSLLSKVEGSPPLFRFQRDIASSLPAFLFLPSSKKYPPSFLPFLSRLVGKKNVARSNEESFFFFSFVYAVEFASVRRLFGARENISAADENNPSIDEIGVAIGGMLENIIGE